MRVDFERHPGARFLIVAASLVVVIAGLRAASVILVPFLVALFLAILNFPLLTGLRRWRVPLVLAVVSTILVNVLVFVSLVLVVTRSLEEFVTTVPGYIAMLEARFAEGVAFLEQHGIETAYFDLGEVINAASVTNVLGGALGHIAALLTTAFLILIILIFALLEASEFPEKLRRAFGPRADLGRWSTVTSEVQRYLLIKTLISLATGVLLGLWTWVLGVDYPLLWGLTAFLLNFIPNIGSIVAAIPPILVALVQHGFAYAGAVTFGYIAVNFALGNVLEPNLMGRKLGISPLIVVLSLIFWGWVLGPVGMLLAVPLTVILKITLEHTRDFRWLAVVLGSPSRDSVAGARLAPVSAPRPVAEVGVDAMGEVPRAAGGGQP